MSGRIFGIWSLSTHPPNHRAIAHDREGQIQTLDLDDMAIVDQTLQAGPDCLFGCRGADMQTIPRGCPPDRRMLKCARASRRSERPGPAAQSRESPISTSSGAIHVASRRGFRSSGRCAACHHKLTARARGAV